MIFTLRQPKEKFQVLEQYVDLYITVVNLTKAFDKLRKLAHLRCTGHVTRMQDKRLPEKGFSMENFRKESSGWPRETLQKHP